MVINLGVSMVIEFAAAPAESGDMHSRPELVRRRSGGGTTGAGIW